GYEAVFLAAGAQASKQIGIPGEDKDLEGLYYGLHFLNGIKKGQEMRLKNRAVVIGGGNVAIDVARTALRAGAQHVQLFCLEPRDEMPAWEKEVEEALDEGIVINPAWSPKQILYQDGKVTGIEFVHCVCVFDDEGCFNPECNEEITQLVEAENVLISIGQAQDMSFLSEDSQLERALWGALVVNENTLSTNIPGVFAGGDFTTGPTYVIRAIASGRRAAIAIDKYLLGESGPVEIPDMKTAMHEDTGLALDEETDQEMPRIRIELEKAEKRVNDFREVEKGLSSQEAISESKRCLRCDLEKERMSI
ncbi:MAG TPA: hydrogenase, partial [Desulfobacterales bacterium]|nr:hydrogenase [Desulfobacterales bacterium]